MTVHFIGAGPGAADLITVRGRDLIARCPVCLYAGSLVPKAILDHCPAGARIVDTAPMSLDEIIGACVAATNAGLDVARLHSGDLSIWSALGEQSRRLDAFGIPYTVTPGVPAFAAAAAALRRELTLPEVAQSVVLTRTPGRASAMPPAEKLAAFAATGATLAIHLSIHVLEKSVAELLPFYGVDCPAAVVYRASWPEEKIIRAPLGELVGTRRCGRRHRADSPHPGGAGSWRRGFSRERLVRCVLSATLPGQAGMSGFRFGFPDQCARAVEDSDIKRNGALAKSARSGRPRRLGDEIAQRLCDFQVGFSGESPERVARCSLRALLRKVQQATRRSPARSRAIRYRRARASNEGRATPVQAWSSWRTRRRSSPWGPDAASRYLSMPPTKSPISIRASSGKACMRRMAASDAAPVVPAMCKKSAGAGDVDPAVDGVNPGGARKWHDDTGGPQDRKAAKDSKPRIERLFRQRLAAGNGDFDDEVVQACAIAPGGLPYGERDHLSRNGIYGGFARWNGKARLCHHADPLAGEKHDPFARRATAESCLHKRSMRDVRIVACILDDTSRRAHAIGFADCHSEGRPSASRKLDLRHRRAFSRDKRLAGGACGCSGARSRGPAPPQRRTWLAFGNCPAAAHRFPSFPRTL